MTSVILADARPIVRSGIRALLDTANGYEVIGEASTGAEAFALSEKFLPDLLITALVLPELDGIHLTQRINEQHLPTKVLLMSLRSNEDLIGALKAGVTGYIYKSCTPDEFLHAVQEVSAGRRFLTDELATRAVDIYVGFTLQAQDDRYESLSTREREVLQLSAEGRSNKEIAERLFISSRTVETHRVNLMRKLNLANQTELVRFALAKGIIR